MRYAETSTHQLFDLTLAIKELTDVLHIAFDTPSKMVSTTIILKDADKFGALNQVHVHLIPRRNLHNITNADLDEKINSFSET